MNITKISTINMSREEWLEQRKKHIGGSDAAAVLGLNQYKSTYALWAEKTGAIEAEDISDKEAVRLGNDLEDYVAKRWSEATGKKVRRENNILINPMYPFAHANIDRAVVGETAGLECKTTSNLDVIHKLEAGEIPDYWYCQVCHYMLVTGAPRWHLCALGFGHGLYTFTIERDDLEINSLARAEREFWDLVESRTPPKTDGSKSTLETIEQLLKQSNGSTIDATAIQTDLMRYAAIKKQMCQLETELKDAEAAIKVYMGEAEKAMAPGYSISWKTQERSTFDRSKWESEHGKIPEEYFKKSASRVFKFTSKEI